MTANFQKNLIFQPRRDRDTSITRGRYGLGGVAGPPDHCVHTRGGNWMRRLRLILSAVGVAGVSLALASCGGGGGGGNQTLTIGDSVPLTGDLADFGPPGEKAANIAADQINKAAKSANANI